MDNVIIDLNCCDRTTFSKSTKTQYNNFFTVEAYDIAVLFS